MNGLAWPGGVRNVLRCFQRGLRPGNVWSGRRVAAAFWQLAEAGESPSGKKWCSFASGWGGLRVTQPERANHGLPLVVKVGVSAQRGVRIDGVPIPACVPMAVLQHHRLWEGHAPLRMADRGKRTALEFGANFLSQLPSVCYIFFTILFL